MPLYEYQCETCNHRFEKIQKFSDPPPDKCPKCGGPVRKLFSSPAIQFKGSGFYITDYAKKSAEGGESASSEKKEKEKSDTKSDKTDAGSTKTDSGSAKTDSGSAKTDTGGKADSAGSSSGGPAPSTTKE